MSARAGSETAQLPTATALPETSPRPPTAHSATLTSPRPPMDARSARAAASARWRRGGDGSGGTWHSASRSDSTSAFAARACWHGSRAVPSLVSACHSLHAETNATGGGRPACEDGGACSHSSASLIACSLAVLNSALGRGVPACSS
eukprot:scaffold8327_cov106-Isochrysis_galbana.AAC.5